MPGAARLLFLCGVLAFSPLYGQTPNGPFPEPDGVVNGFFQKAQQYAALQVIETVIEQTTQPQSSDSAALLERYRAKMAELEGGRSTKYEVRADASSFISSRSFREDVLHRYLPQYEKTAIAPFEQDPRYNPTPDGNPNTNLMAIATALVMLAVPVLYLLRGERAGAKGDGVSKTNAFRLPDSLASIKLTRLRLYLALECGRIYDEQVQTVTEKKTYLRTEQDGMTGQISTSHAGTSVSSVTYHKYFLKTPDGRETWREFADDEFPAAVGEVMSSVSCGDRMLFAFNHTRQKFVPLQGGIGQTLRMRAGRGLWLTTLAVAVAGGAVILSVVQDHETAWRAFWAVPIVLGLFSGVYIVILKILVQIVRRFPFRVLWQPRFRKFMEEQTAPLEQFYSQ